jgi:2-polyprenyl-6-hydroxyphenyl methylase/3-demethylubiquinone-9 3-methyltransferase
MRNIDKEEVKKFNELASKWWDKDGDFKPLHQINPIRLDFIINKVQLNGLKVLDIGCGGGILSESMAKLGAIVTGIDAGNSVIKIAKSQSKKTGSNVNYLNCTCEEFVSDGFVDEFDVITCLEVLEHVPDPSKIVSSSSILCKPEGHIFFSTINRNPKSYLFAVLGAEYFLKLLPKGTHDYQKFIKPSELAKWIRLSNMTLQETIGMLYNPLTDEYWLDKDTSVNYLMHTTNNK